MKTIVNSAEGVEGVSSDANIQNIAIDTNRKRLYWTDPTVTEGKGKISSSNYDGSDKKVIIKDLHWPQGIKIYNLGTSAQDKGKVLKLCKNQIYNN